MVFIALIIINSLYLFLIIKFVSHFITETRSIYVQVFACISCSIALLLLPFSFLFLLINFACFILICFPKRLFVKAAVLTLLTASLLGGVLFVASDYWPLGNGGKVAAFIILSAIVLMYTRGSYFNHSLTVNRKLFVQHYTVQLFEEEFEVEGFIDTGNECTEVISQLPVHFLHVDCLEHERFNALKTALSEWEQNQTIDYATFEKFSLTRIRFVLVNSLFTDSKLSLAFKGEIIYQDRAHPCYFIFVNSEQLFPENARLLLHASFLTTIMKEVNM